MPGGDTRAAGHHPPYQLTMTSGAGAHLTDLDGNRKVIDLNRVKAVFFVKRFEGDPDYGERKEFSDDSPTFGQKIRIVFVDGEVLLGRAMGYRPEEKGFYFKPADPRSNNDVVFVPVGALQEVLIGDLDVGIQSW